MKRSNTAHTAPDYQLYLLPNTTPAKPGLVRCANGTASIGVEVWRVPSAQYRSFAVEIPSPLDVGTITVNDGRTLQVFVCASIAVAGARDISAFDGWRKFVGA